MLSNKRGLAINVFLFLLSASVLLSSYISPEAFWASSFLVLLLIPVLVVNLVALLILLAKRSWWLVFPLLIVGAGLTFLPKLYAWPSDESAGEVERNFRVLSYNTSFFRVGRVFSEAYYSADHNLSALQIADWIRTNGADIICLQEFFDDKNSDIFNNIQTIGAQEGYESYFLNRPRHDNGVRRGLVTFTKFPIINQGTIFLSENRYNGATFVDLLIYSDTVRVINLHLESLNLSERGSGGFIGSVIKNNAIRKSRQVDEVMKYVLDSPYITLVCGDFNEVPNGFLYRQFDRVLTNAFEKKGKGFGFTYQGSLPTPLLRIDNQFYDPELRLTSFTTYRDIGYSDHFPIEGRYQLRDE